jgi:hypothetical protein
MNRKEFDVAVGLVDRIDKLENTIFKLQGIMNKKSYTIIAHELYTDEGMDLTKEPTKVDLFPNEIATVVFVQDILEYYISTFNFLTIKN